MYKDCGITKVVGIESRGFVMGASLAVRLGAGFVPGLIVFVAIVAIITYMCINADKKVKAEYALKGTN